MKTDIGFDMVYGIKNGIYNPINFPVHNQLIKYGLQQFHANDIC